MAQHQFRSLPLVHRRLTVLRTSRVTPRMLRVTLGGDELRAFHRDGLDLAAFQSPGFDDHVKLIFAPGGDLTRALPRQLADTIDWPAAPERETRDYTPRRFDPVAGELDLDFVIHGAGPAASWAGRASAGDELHLAGPKSTVVLPDGIDWVLLAGDETALPAIARFLEERPVEAPVRVVIELGDPAARQELALRDGDTIEWLVTAPGDAPRLAEAVRALDWWPGRPYAWAAAESRALLPLRRLLGREREVPKSHTNITGYWHAEEAPAPGAAAPIDAELLLSPVPWFATRAALETGLLDAVAVPPVKPLAELAAALGLDPAALGTLVAALVDYGVLARVGEALELGPVGELALGDEHLREGLEDGVEARTMLALEELAPALFGGPSAYERRHGHSLQRALDRESELAAEQIEDTVSFGFVAGGLRRVPGIEAERRLALTGPGANQVARVLGEGRELSVFGEPILLEALRAGTPEGLQPLAVASSAASTGPGTDLVVSALALEHRSDDEAQAFLAELAERGDALLLLEEIEGPGLTGPGFAEHRLVALAGSGAATRTLAGLRRLAESAGWRWSGSETLGWNVEAIRLER